MKCFTKILNRGRAVLPLAVTLLSLLLAACSKEDSDYVYPPVVTAYVNAFVNGDNMIDQLVTDRGDTLAVARPISAPDLHPGSYYRMVCMYERLELPVPTAQVYNIKFAIVSTPLPSDSLAHAPSDDPLSLQSAWRDGNYLNVIALPKVKAVTHAFQFVCDSLATHDGAQRLYLRLYHAKNNDVEGFTQKHYLSAPLRNFALQAGDSIILRFNDYKAGMQRWSIAY